MVMLPASSGLGCRVVTKKGSRKTTLTERAKHPQTTPQVYTPSSGVAARRTKVKASLEATANGACHTQDVNEIGCSDGAIVERRETAQPSATTTANTKHMAHASLRTAAARRSKVKALPESSTKRGGKAQGASDADEIGGAAGAIVEFESTVQDAANAATTAKMNRMANAPLRAAAARRSKVKAFPEVTTKCGEQTQDAADGNEIGGPAGAIVEFESTVQAATTTATAGKTKRVPNAKARHLVRKVRGKGKIQANAATIKVKRIMGIKKTEKESLWRPVRRLCRKTAQGDTQTKGSSPTSGAEDISVPSPVCNAVRRLDYDIDDDDHSLPPSTDIVRDHAPIQLDSSFERLRRPSKTPASGGVRSNQASVAPRMQGNRPAKRAKCSVGASPSDTHEPVGYVRDGAANDAIVAVSPELDSSSLLCGVITPLLNASKESKRSGAVPAPARKVPHKRMSESSAVSLPQLRKPTGVDLFANSSLWPTRREPLMDLSHVLTKGADTQLDNSSRAKKGAVAKGMVTSRAASSLLLADGRLPKTPQSRCGQKVASRRSVGRSAGVNAGSSGSRTGLVASAAVRLSPSPVKAAGTEPSAPGSVVQRQALATTPATFSLIANLEFLGCKQQQTQACG
jgi:hypothetical protein